MAPVHSAHASLDAFFHPRSVAVIGATAAPGKVGRALMKNLLAGPKGRKVYPISLTERSVLGVKTVKSITEIKGIVDLALIAVRADAVPGVLAECAAKKVKAAIVISAGFKEAGEKGAALEKDLARVAHEAGMPVLGPNCLGVLNLHAALNASFAATPPKAGGVAFVSQSGALATAVLDMAREEGVGFSSVVSLGNTAVLDATPFLEYLADDPKTEAVLLYVEGITDGSRFMTAAKRVAHRKPLVILKAGRSTRGQEAVASHTGSLAPSDAVFSAAAAQAGAVVVESIRELVAVAKLVELGFARRAAQRLLVVTNGGGPSIVLADLIDLSHSLALVRVPDTVRAALAKVLPPMAALGNPVDLIGDAREDRYDAALRATAKMSGVDATVVLVTPQEMTDAAGIAQVLVKHHTKTRALIPLLVGGPTLAKGKAVLAARGMPSFTFPRDIVEGLEALARGEARPVMPPAPVGSIRAKNLQQKRRVLDVVESAQLLAQHGIAIPGEVVRRPEDLGAAMAHLGAGPVAMKVISSDVVHKTDAGGVRVGIADAEDAAEAWRRMSASIAEAHPGARVEGFLVQPMVAGTEVIIGVKRDPAFGPVVVFGLGGIYTETLKDVTMRVCPLTEADARAMVRGIRAYAILAGARGQAKADEDALVRLLLAVSSLVSARSDIMELDLNPVMARADGAVALDARMVLTV